ncbi:MAG: DUF2877 domain-containing protein, partial [Anaerolineales bacterium]
ALVTAARAMTPFALQVAVKDFGEVSPADSVSVAGDELRLGRLRLLTGEAALWNPVPDWGMVSRALAADLARLAHLAEITLTFGKPGSLLAVFDDADSNPTLNRARRGANALIEGLHSHSMPRCVEGVNALAGLGAGLTPAGDDFICGALFAVWAGLLPSPNGRGAGGEGEIAEAAAPRTTTLSAAYLRAAARGECMALWHNLFTALCDDGRDLRPEIGELLSVGHTSGADALAGFIAAYHWHARVSADHV